MSGSLLPVCDIQYLALQLVRLIYQRIAAELTWRDNNGMGVWVLCRSHLTPDERVVLQRPIGDTTASSHTGGGATGRPVDAPYFSNLVLPQWRPTEIAYRVNGIFRQIIHIAVSQNVDDPVGRWLNQSIPTMDGGRARWPDSVRNLLLANSRVVHNFNRGNGETWIGQNTPIAGGETAPYPGVRAGYDQTMRFYQRGNAGPFSIEAAFLMATQAAGVNFRAVARAYNSNPAGWWFGSLGAGPTANLCLQERDTMGRAVRTYGRFESVAGSTQHDPRAGVYMAFDLDPGLAEADANHNIFLFVVHALDANSVVTATEPQLRAVNVGDENRWYTLATGSTTAHFYNQGSSSDTVNMPTATSNTRLLAVGVEHFRL
ncbi:hypothetical protein FRC08_010888 [Ceratobasidium sp. 394]|nr:hypothetical protein FRC08_010888 [Ceratobasidium sp. 394]KAG9096153.1 hypothetical protein FS749_009024 [Ceratobasidium sp. UAMH 11750]